jgi:Sec-independent protein translocase protein TatA
MEMILIVVVVLLLLGGGGYGVARAATGEMLALMLKTN